jgi:transposase
MVATRTPSPSVPNLVRRVTDAKAKEDRRRLAVQRVLEGETHAAVAASLKVTDRSVRAWMKWYRDQGEDGLKLRPHPGPESKLTPLQEDQVCLWLASDATHFGFRTNLWTSTRIVKLIHERFGIAYNANYFCRWLRKHAFTPQKPAKQASQRDDDRIQDWIATKWPAILKRGLPNTPMWC